MHKLKDAVLNHRLDEISCLAANPQVQADAAFTNDLLRIAREMGNTFTITCLARVFPQLAEQVDARSLLISRVRLLATNYFGGVSLEQTAHRMWMQVAFDTVEPFSKDRADFVLTPELKEDIKFLFRRCGVNSEGQLIALAARGDESL